MFWTTTPIIPGMSSPGGGGMVVQGLQHSGQLQTDSSHILQFVNLVKYRMCRCQLPEFWEDGPAG